MEQETRLTVRLPKHIAEDLRELARIDRRSLNGQIVAALEKYLASQRREPESTRGK